MPLTSTVYVSLSLSHPRCSQPRVQCLRSAAGRVCGMREATRIRRRVTVAGSLRAEADGGAGSVKREGGGGGVAVLTQPPELEKAAAAERASPANFKGNWRVLLHRDEWDTFDYCRRGVVRCACALERTRPVSMRITRP